ncbi:hypothetical protein K431DRAFT_229692 [Polychaeton citri CBS 116435]|uniref:Zinc finger CHCC-type domain-containing protein n=1 Tax=Polychaeton citri CBS 116435 TaxID=1314669 RepID=A0A9P4UKE3_9PEZI|nr:hypothetical protein K431DRAFT_229692 [Polychaeton citri CBS 116435]
MLPRTTRRLLPAINRNSAVALARAYSTPTDNPVPANDPNPKAPAQTVSATNALPTSKEGSGSGYLQETVEEAEAIRSMQAPNRKDIWSRSQQPREKAMVGPRFEQTIMADQPRPLSAMELIHKQPVRWTKSRTVSCDGGGGPLGHPRIFINVDKPQICWCTYCGVPYAHEHHRKHLESLPSTTYPLEPQGDAAEVRTPGTIAAKTGATEGYQSITGAPLEQR